MANGQNIKKAKGSGHPAGISDALPPSKPSESMPLGELESLSRTIMTATTPNVLQKTWKKTEFQALQSKAGIVAGALADFQAAGGLVAVKNVEFEPGRFAVKVYLVAAGVNSRVSKTTDGLDFDLVAVAPFEDVTP